MRGRRGWGGDGAVELHGCPTRAFGQIATSVGVVSAAASSHHAIFTPPRLRWCGQASIGRAGRTYGAAATCTNLATLAPGGPSDRYWLARAQRSPPTPAYDSPVHIYIHVPFCARRCSYCDFAIAVRRATPDDAFVAAIEREWASHAVHASAAEPITTLYFGGGTPSRLEPSSIKRLVKMVTSRGGLAPDAEVTLETNPDDVTPERAVAWASAGVNRVSLGVQSHDPAVLEWMHRTHRVEQVAPAIAALRSAGISNISIDLIFALPPELKRNWRRDLEATLGLEPTHLSLYGLTVEPHTPLFRWTERGTTSTTPDDRYAEEYLQAHAMMASAGFEHYEVSNAGRPGFRARHNSAYWRGVDYLGLGPSAHSFSAGIRRWNVREWTDYQARSARGESLIAGSETLDGEARALESRYLGLRTTDGLPLAQVPPEVRDDWCRSGWATMTDARLRLTVEGWLRLDALVAAARHS